MPMLPFCTFLFIMDAEGLDGLMREAETQSLFDGIPLGEGDITISMIKFANDTLFIGKPSF